MATIDTQKAAEHIKLLSRAETKLEKLAGKVEAAAEKAAAKAKEKVAAKVAAAYAEVKKLRTELAAIVAPKQ